MLSVSGICACAESNSGVSFFRSETYTFSRSEQNLIRRVIERTTSEVRPLLPALPPDIETTVRPGADVTPEIGATADAMPPNGIVVTIDAARPEGVEAIVHKWLRPIMFHELHHLARSTAGVPGSIVERAVFEGMATVFERDFARSETPWGAYPPNVIDWAHELQALPADAPVRDWIHRHPDGRRWIGMKVGAYWVDRAIAKSGRSAADLATVPTADVIALGER